MKLDTGASVSIISSRVYKENFSEIPLQKSDTTLRTYTGARFWVWPKLQSNVKSSGTVYLYL